MKSQQTARQAAEDAGKFFDKTLKQSQRKRMKW